MIEKKCTSCGQTFMIVESYNICIICKSPTLVEVKK